MPLIAYCLPSCIKSCSTNSSTIKQHALKGRNGVLYFLKNSDVVNQHLLRENCCSIRIARPITTDSYVEYDKEWFVERINGAHLRFGGLEVRDVINQYLNIIH